MLTRTPGQPSSLRGSALIITTSKGRGKERKGRGGEGEEEGEGEGEGGTCSKVLGGIDAPG